MDIVKRWGPVLVWMAFIFALSSQSSLPRAPDDILDVVAKKTGHFLEYAVLAGLFFRASQRGQRPLRAVAVGCVVLAGLYAVSDEVHQSFVPGRGSSATDVLIDALGAALAVLALESRAGTRLYKASRSVKR